MPYGESAVPVSCGGTVTGVGLVSVEVDIVSGKSGSIDGTAVNEPTNELLDGNEKDRGGGVGC